MKARNRLAGAVLFAASSLVFSGCSLDDILAVHVPGKVLEEALNSSSLADVLTTGVIAEVECKLEPVRCRRGTPLRRIRADLG